MTTVLANRLIGGILLLVWGFAKLHFDRLSRKEDLEELEAIKKRYEQSPYKIGFLESMLALFGTVGPKAVHIFYAPFLSWVLIIIGSVFVLDVLTHLFYM